MASPKKKRIKRKLIAQRRALDVEPVVEEVEVQEVAPEPVPVKRPFRRKK